MQGVGVAFAARLEEAREVAALQQGVANARKVWAVVVLPSGAA